MSILIGGGTGFVGSAFAAHLKRQGLKYKIISRKSRPDGITWVSIYRSLVRYRQFLIVYETWRFSGTNNQY